MIGILVLVVVVLLVVGLLPRWPFSANWGYGPSGLLTVVLVIVVVLVLMGKL